jgi:glutathione synthase/RimK-type ligase-like ATP-grasp enzyme
MVAMTKRVALATCRELPHLDGDEAPLVRALEARHIPFVIAAWDGPDAPFLESALTVIRSTWDYTARVDEFVAWAARIEEKGRIFNKASVVRWNTHKRYLGLLEREGHAIVPTELVERGTRFDLDAALRARGWTKGCVVKPAVSAGSKDTVRVASLDDEAGLAAARALLARHLPARDMMVQPFVPTIADGELSLVYIDGALSHAVNKTPRGDDFRSQPEFGSVVEKVEPTAGEREAADDILRTVGGGLLYARVDFVRAPDGKRPWLMELELVEPSLYLSWDDAAAGRLADAIGRRL